MSAAPEIIEQRPPAATGARDLFTTLEAAVAARAPGLAKWLPLASRLARFLAVGLGGLAVDSGVFSFIYASGREAWLARAVSLFVATIVTWRLNRAFTFEPSGRAPLVELTRYFGVALLAQGFNYGVFLALFHALGQTRPLACLFASAVLATVFSFTGQSLFAFARPGARSGRAA